MTDVAIVQRVHRHVWETTDYAPDNGDVWGNIAWEDGKARADCEDWADRALKALKDAGVPRSDIGVALVDTQGREGRYNHAVCLVMADELGLMTCGDAYDSGGPRQIKHTRYSFHSFMRLNQPGVWRKCPEGWPNE